MSSPTSVSKLSLINGSQDAASERIRRVEELQQEITTLENQIAGLEEKIARTPLLLRTFGGQFGFGAAGKIAWVRFKLKFMKEELVRFESILPI
jgi:hypothetical protein